MKHEEGTRAEVAQAKAEAAAQESIDGGPAITETVSQILGLCESLGLKPVRRKGYIALTVKGEDGKKETNVLSIGRIRAKEFSRVVKFVQFSDQREKFPESIRDFISKDKVENKYYVCEAQNLQDLRKVLVTCFEAWFSDFEAGDEQSK